MYTRIKIPQGSRGDYLKIAGCLPYNNLVEVGGYITGSSIYYREGNEENVPVPTNKNVVFHTHPPKLRGDMPSELDILNMIFSNWQKSILLTQNKLIMITRTESFDSIVSHIDKRHEQYAMDAATVLRNKGADALLYFLAKDILKKHIHKKGITHRTWPEKWEDFVVNDLGLELKFWDCIPFSCAA